MLHRIFVIYCLMIAMGLAWANHNGYVWLHGLGFAGGSHGRSTGGHGYFHAK